MAQQKEKLQKLNLIKDEAVSNAAKLLFAKELNTYTIHLGRFKTPSMIIDDKIIKTTLFEAVEESMRFIISCPVSPRYGHRVQEVKVIA